MSSRSLSIFIPINQDVTLGSKLPFGLYVSANNLELIRWRLEIPACDGSSSTDTVRCRFTIGLFEPSRRRGHRPALLVDLEQVWSIGSLDCLSTCQQRPEELIVGCPTAPPDLPLEVYKAWHHSRIQI